MLATQLYVGGLFKFTMIWSCLSCIPGLAGAQAGNFPERDGITFSPRWVDNLVFLNHMGEGISPEKQMLYKWAEAVLAGEEEMDFRTLAENANFQSYCNAHGIIHLGGPMLGDITSTSAKVWIRTVKPAEVSVEITIDGENKIFGPVKTGLKTQLSGVVLIKGLQPNSQYEYHAYVGDQMIGSGTIRTSPGNAKIPTRIAFGSCFHRWGLGNPKQANTLLTRSPHAFFGLGDIVTQDRLNKIGWHTLDYLARDLYPAWQELTSKIPFYALWDDHDYFGNDLSGIPPGYDDEDRQRVWEIFRHSWNNPSYGFGDEEKGAFYRTRIGLCDVIMVDHRYFRTPESFLGQAQMQWLKDQLLDCKGPFIVLGTGTMWSDEVSNGKDSWGTADPEAREEIFQFIEQNNIPGVLLISGDRHGSRMFKIERPSGFSFYEFEVASLGGLSGPPATDSSWKGQLCGLSGGFAFGEFTFDATSKDPLVTFRLVSEDNNLLYELKLKRSELTPNNKKKR